MDDKRLLAAALRQLEKLKLQEAFDASDLESRPNEKQYQVFQDFGKIRQQYIRAGNQSGKSQTCARMVAWVLTDSHPFWKRPKEWGQEPLTIIVAARTGKHIEHSLLPKVTGFLEPGTYKEVRVGNLVQSLEMDNGNTILFQSLENANQARERLQSYVAHLVWIDELPPTMAIIRELLVRVQAKNGFFLASFTPTVVALEIQRFIDAIEEPEGKTYRFSMLDNPIYRDPERKKQLISRYAHLSEEQRNMVFEGEWLSGDGQVFYFHYDHMVRMPQGYSPMWRHVEVVDPAISSALGLTLWAEEPDTGKWYCILDTYVKNILVPSLILKEVIRLTNGRNIVKRISDYAPWFTETASSEGRKYLTVQNKNHGRKDELIKQLQEAMGNTIFFAPHCDNIITEIQDCRWADRGVGKIVNSSSYHLLDCAQYFADNIPATEKRIKYESQDQYLYEMNEKRKQANHIKQMKLQKQALRKHGGSRWR